MIYAPCTEELFSAHLGGGAWLERRGRRRRLRVSATAALTDAVLATGFAYVRNETPNANLDNFTRLASVVRGIRRAGSAALDLAYVAAGRLDGFWEMHLQPHDVAAGACIIREAGGRVTDLFGGQDWLHGCTLLATNGTCHDALDEALLPVQPDRWITPPATRVSTRTPPV